MKTTTKIAVAFVTLAGIGAAAVSAQADSRWQAREGGPAKMVQQAHGGEFGRQGHRFHGDRHRGGKEGRHRLYRMLDSFDTNEDGKLTQEEIDTFRSERLGQFDGDGDKSLTLQEYERLWLDGMRERMVDRFQDLDADGDGKVTTEEFQRPFAKVMRRADRNGDGVIDETDFPRRGFGPGQGMGPGQGFGPGQGMGPGQMRGPMMNDDNG